MAIAFDTSSVASDTNNVSTISWSHTCTGSDLTLVVFIGWWDNSASSGPTVSTLTYNGVGMTYRSRSQIAISSAYVTTEVWTLDDPATGGNTVACTLSEVNGGAGLYGMGMSFTGSQGIGSNFGNGTGNSKTASCTFTSGASSSMTAVACTWRGGDLNPFAPDYSETEVQDGNSGSLGGSDVGYWGAYISSSGASETRGCSQTVANDRWAIVAIEIEEAAGVSPVTVSLNTAAMTTTGVKALPQKRTVLDTATLSASGVKALPSKLVRIGTAALAMTGVPFQIAQAVKLNTGALALSGVTMKPSRPVVLGTAALTLAGVKALPSRVVLLNTGALSLAGVTLTNAGPVVIVVLNTGALTLTGVPLFPSKRVFLNTGALSLTGVKALPSRRVMLNTGALTLAGVPFTIALGGVDITVALGTAALALAGVKALPSQRVLLNTGALTTVGVKMLPSRLVQLNTGALTSAGVGLVIPRYVLLNTGTLTAAGVKALPSRRIVLDTASLTLGGVSISLPAAISALISLTVKTWSNELTIREWSEELTAKTWDNELTVKEDN